MRERAKVRGREGMREGAKVRGREGTRGRMRAHLQDGRCSKVFRTVWRPLNALNTRPV